MTELNFTISELLKSDIAAESGIKNIPADVQTYDNMLTLIVKCLQPLRNFIGKPMIITSGYRSQEVNKKAGGVTNSQHLTGEACDFIIMGLAPQQIIDLIKRSGIEFDQCINEYNQWVHISYSKSKNRKQFLTY